MSITHLIVAAVLVLTLAVLAALSRRKKAIVREPELFGARGMVETTLRPEGSVIIRGELWPARSRSGLRIERGREIRVVGARGHLLEVECAA